jgi:hypothetical protein
MCYKYLIAQNLMNSLSFYYLKNSSEIKSKLLEGWSPGLFNQMEKCNIAHFPNVVEIASEIDLVINSVAR